MDLTDVFWTERDALYRYASKILRDPHEAEDAVHDCYVRLAGRPSSERPVTQRRAWVFRVVRNLCIDRLRARQRRCDPEHVPDIAAHLHPRGVHTMTPEHEVMMSDTLRQVREGIQTLPDDEAQTLTLAVVEGLSYEDIAFATDVPIGTVRSRLNRARRMLRDLVRCADDPVGNTIKFRTRS